MTLESKRGQKIAECRRRAKTRGDIDTADLPSPEEVRRQELELRQTELELQNEELRQARDELEANINELYELAPVGYFTLGRNGDIEKTNRTGAEMLGQPRVQLLGRRFATFVSPESFPSFNDFLRRPVLTAKFRVTITS